jgi:hypothetical protein
MSATLDVKPLDDLRDKLVREHFTHGGYVDSIPDEAHREITVLIDNVTDLQQYAADLGLARWTSLVQRWHGWHGEVRLVLALDVPRGVHGAPRQRVA